MKKLSIIIVLALIAILFFTMKGPYNNMVQLDEAVDGKWSEVETAYQRRYDLIIEQVKTVNTSAGFEKDILVEVTKARAAGMGAIQGANGGTDLSGLNQTTGVISRGGMRGMMMGYTEKYPELKSMKLFSDLMVMMEGTENRIAKARSDFNEKVKDYNSTVRTFPNNMYAGIFGFEKRDYFKSTSGAEEGIDVGGKKFGE